MTYLIDSSALFELERGNKKTQEEAGKIFSTSATPAFISFMTLAEFLVGTESRSLENKAKLKAFLLQFDTLHTTNETALILSKLKHDCDKKGLKKSLTDLFIAAQAIEHNLTLITKDSDFRNITELKKIIL